MSRPWVTRQGIFMGTFDSTDNTNWRDQAADLSEFGGITRFLQEEFTKTTDRGAANNSTVSHLNTGTEGLFGGSAGSADTSGAAAATDSQGIRQDVQPTQDYVVKYDDNGKPPTLQ